MKMFSECAGNCCVCMLGTGTCLAGHGDDDFCLASKETIIHRLDNGEFESYRDVMIGTLKSQYGYDYMESEKMNFGLYKKKGKK